MKRIMVADGISANFFIKRTMARAFNFCGYPTVFWQKEGKSCHDIFSEFHPEIFVGSTWQLDRALVKNLIKTEGIKVMLSANHFGSADTEIDRNRFPIEFASDNEKKFVDELVRAGVDLHLMCQYGPNRTASSHDLWDQLGVHCHGILLSADITSYFPPENKPNIFNNSLAFCSGYWRYKAQNLDRYILPLLYPNTKWNIKIFGSGWASPNCLGRADESTLRHFYANSIICPNLFEPHSIEFGLDVNQRSFEIANSWGFQISQRVKSLEEDVFNSNEIVFVDSPEQFFEQCIFFLNNPHETIPYREAALKTVLKFHTSLHRIAMIFDFLGEDSLPIREKIKEVQRKYLS